MKKNDISKMRSYLLDLTKTEAQRVLEYIKILKRLR